MQSYSLEFIAFSLCQKKLIQKNQSRITNAGNVSGILQAKELLRIEADEFHNIMITENEGVSHLTNKTKMKAVSIKRIIRHISGLFFSFISSPNFRIPYLPSSDSKYHPAHLFYERDCGKGDILFEMTAFIGVNY